MQTIILNNESPSIQYLCKKDKKLAYLISKVGPISYMKHEDDPFSFLVHEIIEQMLSIKAGIKIYQRLQDLCDGKITPEKILALSQDKLKGIGTSANKALYIRCISSAIINKAIDLDTLKSKSDNEVIQELIKLKGVGQWTAKMYLIFVLDRQDVLPYEDVAFIQSYKWLYNARKLQKEVIKKNCKKWKPYSSIAARYLYRALDSGLTKENKGDLLYDNNN